MENSFLPSLSHLSLAKVALSICYGSEVQNLPRRFNESWKISMNKKIATLKLPIELQVKVTGALRPILIEIEEWMDNHDYLTYPGSNLLSSICWKSEGIIDREETALKLTENENIKVINRFYLACNHCLKDEIWDLWCAMPENEKDIFEKETSTIVKYWLTYVRKGFEPLKGWTKIFHDADTLPYFLQKLTSADDKLYLMINMFPEVNLTAEFNYRDRIFFDFSGTGRIKSLHPLHINTNIMRLFFSQMDRDQQIILVKHSPLRVLEYYLHWPLQCTFMNVLGGLWEYLSEENFLCLLQLILYKKIAFGFEDFDYVRLLKEVWLESPEHYKAYIKEDDIFNPLMHTINSGVSKPYTRQNLWQTAMHLAFKWSLKKHHYMCFSLQQMLFAAGIKHEFTLEFSRN